MNIDLNIINKKIEIKNYFFLFFITSISFLISANIAWFNPFPNQALYRVFDKIPFLWQYNVDVPVEILSATGFLEYFERDPTRLERPGLPFLAYILGHIFFFLNFNIIDLPIIYFTAGSYILVNFILHFISAILLYKILKIYFSENISKIGLIIFFLNYITIRHFAEIHTNNMHLLVPIIITYFVFKILNKESFLNIFLFSIIFGFLVLIKSLYSFYITVLIFFLFKKKYLTIIYSILSHLIPIIFWLLILKIKNLEFYSATMLGNTPGHTSFVTWFFNDLINFNFENIFRQLIESLKNFLILFIKYYNFLIIFIFLGFSSFLKTKYSKIKKDLLIFTSLAISLAFVQFYMTQKISKHTYMGGDYFLISLFYILFFFQKFNLKKSLVTLMLVFILLINTIKLPYILPFNQGHVEWENKFKLNSKSLKYFD